MNFWKTLLTVSIVFTLAVPAMAQDNGAPDSIKIAFSALPVVGTNVPVVVQCSVYVDANSLTSIQFALKWDNPNLDLDSAKAIGAFDAMDIGPFFYLDNVLQITNDSQVAICSGTSIFNNFPAAAGWRHIATYYGHMTSWTGASSLTIDTVTLPAYPSTEYIFIPDAGLPYFPHWNGAISIGSPVVNQPPVLDPIGNKLVNENDTLRFFVNAFDMDDDAIFMAIIDTDLPEGYEFFPVDAKTSFQTYQFRWVPTLFDSGTYTATFVAYDGISADSETITITVNNVIGTPNIVLSDDTLDFGDVYIGYPDTLTLRVSNNGSALLEVTAMNSDNPRFSVLDAAVFNVVEGQFQDVRVQFLPIGAGLEAGTLSIASNDPADPTVTVQLLGNGLNPPVISVSPDSLYENLFAGDTSIQLLTVFNGGGSNLNVDLSAQFVAGSGAPSITLQPSLLLSRLMANYEINLKKQTMDMNFSAGQKLMSTTQSSSSDLLHITSSGSVFDGFYTGDHLSFGLTDFGEIMPFQFPVGNEHLQRGTFLSGYTIAYRVSGVDRIAFAAYEGGRFGIVPVSYTEIVNDSSEVVVEVVTKTDDNLIYLTHTFTFDRHDKYVNIQTDIENVSGGPVTDIVFKSYADWDTDFDYTGNFEDDNWDYDLSRNMIYAWDINYTAIATSRIPDLMDIFGWDDYNQRNTFVDFPTGPVFALDGLEVLHFELGNLAPGANTLVETVYGAGSNLAELQSVIDRGLKFVGWLEVEPPTAVIPAGMSLDFQIMFDATGLIAGDYLADILINSNDPAQPRDTVPVSLTVNNVIGTPNIVLSDDTLDFGDVYIGYPDTLTLRISNTGSDLLEVTAVSSNNPRFSVLDATVFNVVQGQFQDVRVQFLPTGAGLESGALLINSNDPDSPVVTVVLQGQGLIPPVIGISIDSLEEHLFTGDTVSRSFTITNSGGSDLNFAIDIFSADAPEPALGESNPFAGVSIRELASITRSIADFTDSKKMAIGRTFTHQSWQESAKALPLHTDGFDFKGPIERDGLLSSAGTIIISDPPGDPIIDIISVSGATLADAVWFELRFSTLIDPDDFGGYFSIDIDQNRATGFAPSFGLETQDIGAEFEVHFFEIEFGYVVLYENPFSTFSTFPVILGPNTISFALPLSALGNDDGSMDVTGVIGNNSGPTDWFPDIGHGTLAGLSWLTASPIEGVIPAGESIPVSVKFDAGGLSGGDYYASMSISSNDPLRPQVEIPAHLAVTGAPNIAVSPDSIDFGPLFIGASKVDTILVENIGTDVLNVTSVTSNNSDFAPDTTSFTLNPGEVLEKLVIFTPSTATPIAGLLTVSSNDPDMPSVTVVLQGQGLNPPVISVSPDSLHANLFTGEMVVETLTVANIGGSDLDFELTIEEISGLVASGSPNDSVWALHKFATADFGVRKLGQSQRMSGANSAELHDETSISPTSPRGVDSGSPILVIQNSSAWGVDMYSFILANFGIAATVINTDQIASTNFNLFDIVLTVGDQDFTYYIDISSNLAKFESFVSAGGVVQYQLATQGDNVSIVNGVNVLYGNLEYFNQVLLPGHPIVAGLPALLEGNYANHCYLTNLPPDAQIITETDNTNLPTTVEYSFGSGQVIATGMTWEFLYINGYNSGPMLYNALAYSLSLAGVSWLSAAPASGTIPAESSIDIEVTFDATGLNAGDYLADILINSNDPAHPRDTVPVSLTVNKAPCSDLIPLDFSLDGPQQISFNRSFQSRINLIIQNLGPASIDSPIVFIFYYSDDSLIDDFGNEIILQTQVVNGVPVGGPLAIDITNDLTISSNLEVPFGPAYLIIEVDESAYYTDCNLRDTSVFIPFELVNNITPTYELIGKQTVNEGQTLSFVISATDFDGDELSYFLEDENIPGPFNVFTFDDSGNGRAYFEWTPNYNEAGQYELLIYLDDNRGPSIEINISLTVNNVNRPPVLDFIGDRPANENQNLNFAISATDPDGTTPTLTSSTLPDGATFVDNLNGTGTFNWTPSFTQSGDYNITFRATDESLVDSEVVQITVSNVNRPPVLNPIGPQVFTEKEYMEFDVSGFDLDEQDLVFSTSALPDFATFHFLDGVGTFSWTPQFDQSGVYIVSFYVSDGMASDTEAVTITVQNVNQPPVLDPIGPQTFYENQYREFHVTGFDPDLDEVLQFTISSLPPGAVFIPSIGGYTFGWEPNSAQVGVYSVTFYVSDGQETDSEVVTITVENVPCPDLSISALILDEPQQISFNKPLQSRLNLAVQNTGEIGVDDQVEIEFFISEDSAIGDCKCTVLEIGDHLESSVPLGGPLAIDLSDDFISLPFDESFVPGPAWLCAQIDGNNEYNDCNTENNFVCVPVVLDFNIPPVLNPIGNKEVDEGETLSFTVSSFDPDNFDQLYLYIDYSNPNENFNPIFVDSGNGTGYFEWTPDSDDAGEYNVTFYSCDSDKRGAYCDKETITITVNNINPPVISVSPDSLHADLFTGEMVVEILTVANIGGSDLDFEISVEEVFLSAVNVSQNTSEKNTGVDHKGIIDEVISSILAHSGIFKGPLEIDENKQSASGTGEKFDAKAFTLPEHIANTNYSFSSASGLDVAVLGAVGTPEWNIEVQGKLLGTGYFSSVSVINVGLVTPTLAELQAFEAVLVFSDAPLQNSTLLGNVLADYVDGGGGVVATTFATASIPIGGRFNAENYWAIAPSGQTQGTRLFLGTIYDPTHPILNGVTSFDGGSSSFRQSSLAIATGATRIADWTDGTALVATKVINGTRRADLGFYPPSTDSRSDFWEASTDGELLMANALRWVARGVHWLSVNPVSGTVSAGSSLDIEVTLDATGLNGGDYLADILINSNDPAQPQDTVSVSLTVTNLNRPPVLDPIGPQTFTENVYMQFDVTGNDPDEDDVSFSSSSLPDGASLFNSSFGGTFTWRPRLDQSDVYNVSFYITDGQLVDTEQVTITVLDVPCPDLLIADFSLDDPQQISFNKLIQSRLNLSIQNTGEISVDDNVALTFYVSEDSAVNCKCNVKPIGFDFVESVPLDGPIAVDIINDLVLTFDESFDSGLAWLCVVVDENDTYQDCNTENNFVCVPVVLDFNIPPVLNPIGNKDVGEGQTLSFTVSSFDPDNFDQLYLYIDYSNPNENFNPIFVDSGNGTGYFEWTPDLDDVGEYSVTFYSCDIIDKRGGYCDEETITITVNNTNRPPVLDPIADQIVDENKTLHFEVNANDPDEDCLNLYMTSPDLPDEQLFFYNGDCLYSGYFEWTPGYDDAGTYIAIFVADDKNSIDADTVIITVNNANAPPTFGEMPLQSTNENVFITFDIFATDIDGTIQSLSADELPLGAEFVDHGDGTGTFSWTPDCNQSNDYSIRFLAVDNSGASGTGFIELDVLESCNVPLTVVTTPCLLCAPPQNYTDILVNDDNFSIVFNNQVDQNSLEENISFNSARGSALGYEYNSKNRSLEVYPIYGDFSAIDTIMVTLDNTIYDLDESSLDSAYHLTYLVGPVVYPGDCNNDGTVDEVDVLSIGLFWNEAGPDRYFGDEYGPLDFFAQPAHFQELENGEWDPKIGVYADVDGSGVVDANDLCGIAINFAETVDEDVAPKGGGNLAQGAALAKVGSQVLEQMRDALIECPDSAPKTKMLEAINNALSASTVILPTEIELHQNYPNPFNPNTTIEFALPKAEHAVLEIYNMLGQRVVTLVDEKVEAGYQTVVWNGADYTGKSVASGIYFYRLKTESKVIIKRMLLVK